MKEREKRQGDYIYFILNIEFYIEYFILKEKEGSERKRKETRRER